MSPRQQYDTAPPSTEVDPDATAPDGTGIEVHRNYGKPSNAAEIAQALREARKAKARRDLGRIPDEEGPSAQARVPRPIPAAALEALGTWPAGGEAETPPAKGSSQTPPRSAVASGRKRKPAPQDTKTAGAQTPAPEPLAAAQEPADQPPTISKPKVRPATPAQLRARREAQERFAGMKPMHVVEAALFSAGKPLAVEEIAETTGLGKEAVREGIKDLAAAYESRDSVLEVGKAGAKWAMQVRSRAAEPASKFAPMEIPAKVLKTLALIAYHQPMKQSELVDMIGTKVYDHVPELLARGLVRAREEGVTKVLSTTALFPEYFGLDAEDTQGVRAALARLVGLPPPPPKAKQGLVYEEPTPPGPEPGETPIPDA